MLEPVSNEQLNHLLEEVARDVKELRKQKLDVTVHDLANLQLNSELQAINRTLSTICFYARWGSLIVGGVIITAILNLVILSQ